MLKIRITALILLVLGLLVGYFVYSTESNESRFSFKYGLDLDGGTHLTYRADTTGVEERDVNSAMDALRRTVERRVNTFGVSEPIVQVEKGGVFSEENNQNRLIVELPGVTDIDEAIAAIGRTPVLEFRLASDDSVLADSIDINSPVEEQMKAIYNSYSSTGLGGAQLKKASIVFDQTSYSPVVTLEFNKEGSDLFASVTKNNVGKRLGIFLDGQIISDPYIRQEITGGVAQITGSFSTEEAKALAQDLNLGALPLPIELIETQTIGASLGQKTLDQLTKAFFIAFLVIVIFLIIWYRLPGLVAVVPLAFYVFFLFALFKVIPVTLTSAGLAAFILSIGMAVDANILIFERIKDELKRGDNLRDAVIDGFKRAWLPIRDGNLSSILSAVVLYWLSGTAVVKGFALVFFLGVVVSMFTAITITRTFLLAFAKEDSSEFMKKLFGSGFSK